MKKKRNSGGLLIAILIIWALLKNGGTFGSLFGLLGGLIWTAIIGMGVITALIILLFVISQKNKDEKGNSEANNRAPIDTHTYDPNRAKPTYTYTPPQKDDLIDLDADDAAAIRKGRLNLLNLRKSVVKIRNNDIRTQANEICTVMDKILQTLKTKPDQIKDVRQFLNYYMPTLHEIIHKYETIEASGVMAPDMTKKVSTYLGQIKQAMDKQYENLFEDDKLDLTVEMEAMTLACKQDGLLEDENAARIDAGEQGITLTL